jgi:hypothetical protein
VTAETVPDLLMPAAAAEEWFTCGCGQDDCGRAGFQAPALPIVVAAELRRIADEADARSTVGVVGVISLRRRADELDPNGA